MLRSTVVLVLIFAWSATAADARGLAVSAVRDPVRQIQAGARLRVEYSVRDPERTTGKRRRPRGPRWCSGRTVIALTNGRVPRLRAPETKALAVTAVVPARPAAGAYRVRGVRRHQAAGRAAALGDRRPRPMPPAPAPLEPTPPAPLPAPAPADTTPPASADAHRSAPSRAPRSPARRCTTGPAAAAAFTVAAGPRRRRRPRRRSPRSAQGWSGGASDAAPPFTASYGYRPAVGGRRSPLTAAAFDAAGQRLGSGNPARTWSATAPRDPRR